MIDELAEAKLRHPSSGMFIQARKRKNFWLAMTVISSYFTGIATVLLIVQLVSLFGE